jgi:hypothetical protein
MPDIRHEGLPVLLGDSPDERVRIVVGGRDEGEDLSCHRIERDGRADLVGEERLCELLEAEIDREGEALSGGRRFFRRLENLAAERVDDDRSLAGRAREETVVDRLDPREADVVAEMELFGGTFQVLEGRLAKVAEDVRGSRGVLVVT